MILQNFNVTSVSIVQFDDFCEHLEMAQELEPRQNEDRKKPPSESRSHRSDSRKERKEQKVCKHSSRSFDSSHYCMYHGKDKDHDTQDF